MPIELIPPQREGLHFGLMPCTPHWRRVLRRLTLPQWRDASASLVVVNDAQEAEERCDLVFELHRSHWRLVEPNARSTATGISHGDGAGHGLLGSVMGAVQWITELLNRPAGTSIEYPDLRIWLQEGGHLEWRRMTADPMGVDDVVMSTAEWLVGAGTRRQFLDLNLPPHRGAKRRFMALQQALQGLLPDPGRTWVVSPWGRTNPDEWPRAKATYLVLQPPPPEGLSEPVLDLKALRAGRQRRQEANP